MQLLTVDLSPPTVPFSDLKEGELFTWNGQLWMVFPHTKVYGDEEGFYSAVLISNQETGYGYRSQMFKPEHHVTPCKVAMKVTRLG